MANNNEGVNEPSGFFSASMKKTNITEACPKSWTSPLDVPSVVVMLILLYSLTRIFLLLQGNAFTKTEWVVIKLPFLFYLSWICVATIANISTLLISLNWHGGFLSEEYWTVAMIVVATLLGLFIAFIFKEPAFLLVLMWAFFGIYSRWAETEYELIATISRIATLVLAILFGKLLIDSRKISKS